MAQIVIGTGLHNSRFDYVSRQPRSTRTLANQNQPRASRTMTTEENEPRKIAVETNSERYGNNTAIEDVYDSLAYPKPQELEEALTATGFLTDKESFAFVYGRIEGFPHLPLATDEAEEIIQNHGFNSSSEFKSIKQTATRKIADAIWIFELIDAYRYPDFPDECQECGNEIFGPWVRNQEDDETTVQCTDCADIDLDQRPNRFEYISDDE